MFDTLKLNMNMLKDSAKINANMLKDSVLMRTTIFAGDELYRKDNSMKTEYKDDDAKAEAIKTFNEGYYTESGKRRAKDIVKTINQGTLFNFEPIDYQDHVADQDDLMMAVATYIAEAGPDGQIKINHMTNKFIVKLNETCEFLGMPRYVKISEKELETRQVVFDAPDYSQVSPEIAKALKKELEDQAAEAKARQEYIDNFEKETQEYNAKLKEEAIKEYQEAEAKKAEKEAKKAAKKAEREAKKEAKKAEKEAKKADDKKAGEVIEDAEFVDLDKNIGIPSFKSGRDRAAVSKSSTNSAGSTKKSSASKDAGKGGKSEDSGDGDPDPASQKVVDLNRFIPTEEVVKNFPIIDVDDEEKEKLLAQNELERIQFIRAHGGSELRSIPDSEATKKVQEVAATLNSGEVPTMETVQNAIDAVTNELSQRNLMSVHYETGRFTAKEVGKRTDIELIQDALNEACSCVPGITASVTPAEKYPDKYIAQIMQNGVVIDTFTAYGSRMMGRGVPVLDANAEFITRDEKTGAPVKTIIPYFAPLHSMRAVRDNIFRNATNIKNIHGQDIEFRKCTSYEVASGLESTICKDFKILDHIDLSAQLFKDDIEAASFFHVAAAVLNLLQVIGPYPDESVMPRYRLANYKRFDKFELFGDPLAFNSRPEYKPDTTINGKVIPTNGGPDYRRIIVSGNNVQVIQPDGNVVKQVIAL